MNPPSRHPSPSRSAQSEERGCAHQSESGFALVLVLSMIALVTVLVVAYLNRSASENVISRASAGGGNSETLARTALEILQSDLRGEIVSNSIAIPATVSGGVDYYRPSTPQAAVPVRVLKPDDQRRIETLPNLVKVSAAGIPFSGTNGPLRASAISTTTASIEGKTFTTNRWNAPLLLTNPFTPPDWIYLTRSGANPIDSNLSPTNKVNGTDPILGRYAYMIYDEGGLLDINHAGAPTQAAGFAGGVSLGAFARKGYLALADLTKVGLSSDQIKTIITWRNPSSAEKPDSFLQKLKADPSGRMRMAEGDRPFVSRAQLLSFFRTNSLPTNSLAFLGTFSRGLNQPSYGTAGPKIPGRAAFPPLLDSTSGTYNLPPGGYTGNNDLAGQESQVNPNFLSLKVTKSFPRFQPYLASLGITNQAVIGDLLVPDRFPLDRLAWLTYQGPIAPGGNLNLTLAQPLLNAGFSQDFLKLGTEANIASAVGLTWAPDPGSPGSSRKVWVYTHSTGTEAVTGNAAAIGMLSDVQKVGRDPDFFELLKASIYCGSLGKAAYTDKQTGLWQHAHDVRVDYQILQIGANIVDQYKSDGYPTEIALPLSYTGSTMGLFERKVRGSQNLPMIYGSRNQGILCQAYSFGNNNKTYTPAAAFSPALSYTAVLDYTNTIPNTFASGGLLAAFRTPWIWNPYSTNCALPSGAPCPTQFRVLTSAGDPVFMTNADKVMNPFVAKCGFNGGSANLQYFTNGRTAVVLTPTTNWTFWTNPLTNAATCQSFGPNLTNSELDLTIPAASRSMYFSQPTALVRMNTPGDCKLRPGASSAMLTNAILPFPAGMNNADIPAPSPSTGIVGVLFALSPALTYTTTTISITNSKGGTQTFTTNHPILPISDLSGSFNCLGKSGQANNLTHLMQYQDQNNNWVTYDIKPLYNSYASDTFIFLGQGFANPQELIPTNFVTTFFNVWADPRSGRFGSPSYQYGPQITASYRNDATAAMATLRPDAQPQGKNGLSLPKSSAPFFWGPNLAGSLKQIGFLARGGLFGSLSMQSTTGGSQGISYYPQFYPQNSSFSGNYNYNGYLDPDGVQRGGMAFYASDKSINGLPLAQTNFPARPVILHRPFVSVADLGYTFRDMPFRNLDFMTQQSGDSGLLDTFCIHEDMTTNSVVAGKVNLNTRNPEVLAALLSGTGMEEYDTRGSATLTTAAVSNVISLMTNWTQSSNAPAGPFTQLGDLVGRYNTNSGTYAPSAVANGAVGAGAYASYYSNSLSFPDPSVTSTNNVLQRYREAPVRVFSEVGETRVWNLLIDLVAQSGICPPASSSLDRFNVKGETRWWIHLAIDRATGRILDSQVETVSQ